MSPSPSTEQPPPRLSIVTLGVADVGRATRFYESLGWQRSAASQQSITFLRMAGGVLALYEWNALAEDAEVPAEGSGFRGVTLASNQDSEAAVDAAFAAFVEAGATPIKEPTKVFWGGYSSYVADLDGHLWEIAYNPYMPLLDDGRLELTS
jgi:uncharacterized protein